MPKKTPKKIRKAKDEDETVDEQVPPSIGSPQAKSKRKTKTPKAKTPRKKSTPTKNEELGSDSELEVIDQSTPQNIKKLEAMRARMDLLERDNYMDRKGSGGRSFTVNINDEEEWNNMEQLSSPKKGTKRKKKDADEPNSKKKKTETGKKAKTLKFTRRKFDQVLKMDKTDSSPSPNYFSILTQPSILPTRKFCNITGFKANYTCPHSGDHFTSVEAYGHVKKNHQLE